MVGMIFQTRSSTPLLSVTVAIATPHSSALSRYKIQVSMLFQFKLLIIVHFGICSFIFFM